MHVVIADRNIDGARALAAEINAEGQKASAVEVDVSSKASVAAMVDWTLKSVGEIDALFANAGFNRRAPIDQITLEDWDAMMNTHVKGVFLCNQAVIPGMLACGKGLNLDEAKVNIHGGAVALGHPIAASGARLLLTLSQELRRQNKRYGLASLCIGGGQGQAWVSWMKSRAATIPQAKSTWSDPDRVPINLN